MKKWEAPKLIVLVRSNPEESLVLSCKGGQAVGDPNAADSACYFTSDGCMACLQWTES
jgi:hypothetical protein